MEHQRVPVGILEQRHVAHARVDDLAVERDALALQLRARRGDVVHVQREHGLRGPELLARPFRLPEPVALLADPELGGAMRVLPQPERADVELDRTLDVLCRNADEVDLRDLHYPTEPSIWS